MKSRTDRLTDAERKELRRTPIKIGGEESGSGPLLVYPPAESAAEWQERYGELRHPTTREGWAERTREILGDDAPTVFDADS